MTNNKQQTAVDIIYQGMNDKIVMQDLNKALICIHISHDDFLKLHRQAKEMERQRIENAFNSGYNNGGLDTCLTPKQYYEQTYGGGEQ
jgi:predicted oxidoreductase